ncbi:MAG: DegT/DnrJ/EryC1/StrS family aminotransferase [Bryobacterales bacterium]|nr:DegT/DnrJ/EryC1/StrS family aminotransferase [Bryobacterales bacterium]
MSVSRGSLPASEGGVPIRPASRPVTFGAPVIEDLEIAAVINCLRSGWIGEGPRVAEFEQSFARYKGCGYAAALNSCTSSLNLSLIALGVGPGDEVIVPAMTFCATANVVVHAGATPVFADCDPATLNITASEVERRLTPRTKAVIVVHMHGRAVEMADIIALAKCRNIRVIEDCAHAIETTSEGVPAGLAGDIGCFSFYPTKNLTTGDGGMALSQDRNLIRRIKRLSTHGLDRDAWQRLSGGSYRVVLAGFKCNMTDLDAALGQAQLSRLEDRWLVRERLWREYTRRLSEANLPIDLPLNPSPGSRHAFHLYSPRLRPGKVSINRDQLISALAAENVGSGIHYPAVHDQPYYRKRFGFQARDFPNAHRIGLQTFSLPLTGALTMDDVADCCEALTRILRYYSKA